MKTIIKRIMAYVVDIIIVGVIIFMISNLVVDANKIINLNQQLNMLNEQVLKEGSNLNDYYKDYALINQQLDLENVFSNIFTIILILLFFVFIPYNNKGQTIGMKMLSIKIVTNDKERLTLRKLMIRNFIVNGLIYLSLSLVFLYILSPNKYFVMTSILGFLQLGLVIVSAFMILYRRDKRGIQDILSKTNIKEISEEV